MYMDDAGHFIKVETVRGRRRSLERMAGHLFESAEDLPNTHYFICHGDCIDDVHVLEDIIERRVGRRADRIVYTGTVIGAHTGPGVVALFFWAKQR